MLSFLHAADFHLDAPFSALSPDRAAARREELRALPSRLCDLARERAVQLLLLSGDLFDHAQVYRDTLEAFSRALGSIPAKVFIAPGNHDFYSLRSPWTAVSWPANVHIFTSPAIEAVELPQLGCVVYGAAFTSPFRDDSPLSQFQAPDDGRAHIMVLHGDVDASSRYAPIPSAQIARSGLTYLALGHVHTCSGPQRAGETLWAYPGCPEGRGFDETGEKGVLCGSVSSRSVSLSFCPLCSRRYEILRVNLSEGLSPEAALAAALPKGAQRDIYRILLTGESGPEGLDLDALAALAAPSFYALSLRDHTRVRRALWSRAEEDTLTGLFLRSLRDRLSAAQNDEERSQIETAVRFGLAALENREEPRT